MMKLEANELKCKVFGCDLPRIGGRQPFCIRHKEGLDAVGQKQTWDYSAVEVLGYGIPKFDGRVNPKSASGYEDEGD